MAFPDLFKLEKLTISAFADPGRSKATGDDPFEAMFNPTSLQRRYGIRWVPSARIRGVLQEAHFDQVLPSRLEVQLLLDGTGVNEIGPVSLVGASTVTTRIQAFLACAYTPVGDIHEPPYLKVRWGDLGKVEYTGDAFHCRLASADVTYSSFNRDGSPLRAQIDARFVGDGDVERQAAALGFNSPDVTHSRLVRQGDTLPAMTRAVYGDPRHMIEVARANRLPTLRAIEPGRELVFPPIARGGGA